MTPSPSQKGFTLLELMVVIAMIAIIVGISLPDLNLWVQKQKLSKSARSVLGLMQTSRSHAIEKGIPVAITFSKGVGQAGSYLAFEDPNENFTRDSGEPLLESGFVERSVAIKTVEFVTPSGGNTVSYTGFDGMGLSVGHSGRVVLSDVYNQTATLALSSAGTFQITTSGQTTTSGS